MDIYLPADKEVDGAENVTLSGKFLSKVYEGSLRETEKWCRDFGFAESREMVYVGCGCPGGAEKIKIE